MKTTKAKAILLFDIQFPIDLIKVRNTIPPAFAVAIILSQGKKRTTTRFLA
jgi:hypothetical protein